MCSLSKFCVVLWPLVARRLPDGVGDSVELSRPQEPRPCEANYRGSEPYRHPEEFVRQVLANERAAEHTPGGRPPGGVPQCVSDQGLQRNERARLRLLQPGEAEVRRR